MRDLGRLNVRFIRSGEIGVTTTTTRACVYHFVSATAAGG